MRLFEMGIDKNGRSMTSTFEVPMTKVSETESLSAKQPAVHWRMGFRNLGDPAVAPPPGYSDFLNSTTAVDGTGQAGPYWRLLDYFRREM